MIAEQVGVLTAMYVESEQGGKKPDPLVALKQKELDLRAMDMQRKAEETRLKQDLENQRAGARLQYDYDKLQQQDEQSDERLQVAREKIAKK